MESFVSPTSTLTITPLMRSIYVNGARVIDKLLELGVDINSQVEANGNLTGKCEHMISIFSSPKFTKGHFFAKKDFQADFNRFFSCYVVGSMQQPDRGEKTLGI